MAIDFPASPSVNDTYVVGSVTYTWDGTKWTALTGSIVLDKIEEGNTSAEVIDTGSDGRFVVTTEGTQRLLIDSSGRLGLGTSSADNKLSVGIASADEGIELKATYNGFRIARFGLVNPGVDNTPYIGSLLGSDFGFITNSTRRMTLTADGKLGIGSTGPQNKLVVSNGGAEGLEVRPGATAGEVDLLAYNRSTSAYADMQSFAAKHRWNIGGNEAMRIDASSRLLVGTSSTRSVAGLNGRLQVEGTGAADSTLTITCNSATPHFGLTRTGSAVIGSTTLVANNDLCGRIYFNGTDGAGAVPLAFIDAAVDGTPGSNDMPGRLVFSTTLDGASSPTERMRITNAGTVVSYIPSATSDTLNVYNTTASAVRFYVTQGGTVFATNTTISAISDQRLKENIRDIDVGLNEILALKPRVFDWKKGCGKEIKNDKGFIAQEFEEVFPDLVDTWKGDVPEGEEPYKSVRQDLIPVLIKAIQEQQAMITELQTKVAALEAS